MGLANLACQSGTLHLHNTRLRVWSVNVLNSSTETLHQLILSCNLAFSREYGNIFTKRKANWATQPRMLIWSTSSAGHEVKILDTKFVVEEIGASTCLNYAFTNSVIQPDPTCEPTLSLVTSTPQATTARYWFLKQDTCAELPHWCCRWCMVPKTTAGTLFPISQSTNAGSGQTHVQWSWVARVSSSNVIFDDLTISESDWGLRIQLWDQGNSSVHNRLTGL